MWSRKDLSALDRYRWPSASCQWSVHQWLYTKSQAQCVPQKSSRSLCKSEKPQLLPTKEYEAQYRAACLLCEISPSEDPKPWSKPECGNRQLHMSSRWYRCLLGKFLDYPAAAISYLTHIDSPPDGLDHQSMQLGRIWSDPLNHSARGDWSSRPLE